MFAVCHLSWVPVYCQISKHPSARELAVEDLSDSHTTSPRNAPQGLAAFRRVAPGKPAEATSTWPFR